MLAIGYNTMPDVGRITNEARSAPQTFSPLRRKVTFACETCRKRRVKCSGRPPCDFCAENDRTCIFNDKSRGRRGPRPRQTVSKVIRVLAPAPPRDETPGGSPGNIIVIPQPTVVSIDSEESEEDELDGDEVLPLSTWKQGLETILFRGDKAITEREKRYLELVCHLVELLWTRGPLSMRSFLPAAYLLEQISLGTCPRGLILAICAYTIKYSVHKTVKGDIGRNFAKQFESEARQEADISRFSGKEFGHVQIYCMLAWYAASKGDGKRAWVDMAIARSLLELAITSSDEETTDFPVLRRIEQYLDVNMLYHSIGNTSLQTQCQLNHRLQPSLNTPDDSLDQFSRLLLMLTRIQQLCLRPFSQHEPPPWILNSDFQVLQDELKTYLIRQPRTFYFGAHDNHTFEDTDAARCALAWHCCTILLSRTFLPIPERSRSDGDGSDITTVTTTNFPGVPQLFLSERIHSCEASAAAICVIGKEIVAGGRFFLTAPWLGYSCMQSAIVLINQLHRATQPYDEKITDNLKFAFTILRITESLYAPAHEWIETLFRVHDINTPLRHHSDTVDAAFHDYFSRFVGIDEPSFVTMHPKEIQEIRKAPVLSNSLVPVESRNTEKSGNPTGQNGGRSWLQSYVNHLDENISGDEDEVASQSKQLTSVNPSPNNNDDNDEYDSDDDVAHRTDGSKITSGPTSTALSTITNPLPELEVALADNSASNSNNLSGSWQGNVMGGGGELDNLYTQFGDMGHANNDSSGDLSTDMWSAMVDRVLGGDEQWAEMLANEGDFSRYLESR